MYKISVPIMNHNCKRADRDKSLAELKKLGAERVFLALDEYTLCEEKRQKEMSDLKENCLFYQEHGFEVGAWIWAFTLPEKSDFVRMTAPDGKTSERFCCPSDPSFRSFAREYIRDIAKTGVTIIMFDDDLRYQNLGGVHCFCKNHLSQASKQLRENISAIDLYNNAFIGRGNKYRDAWLNSNGFYLKQFALDMREAVDSVNPEIRLGACSCISSWSCDGILPSEISKILAGKTKPFLRTIGAPYWAESKSFGMRLNDIIELERMESVNHDNDIEVFSEGDVYPRPRYKIPSAYLELFDMAMRFDGHFDGILKYAIDYNSSISMETGYTDRHVRNAEKYRWIEKNTAEKDSVGVRIYSNLNRISTMNFDKDSNVNIILDTLTFSPSLKVCSELSIPTIHKNNGICGMAFGDDVLAVPREDYKNGLIIDMEAAMILKDKGVDVGIGDNIAKINPTEEFFPDFDNEYYPVNYPAFKVELKNGCEISSYFSVIKDDGTSENLPASFFYENDKGEKFFVLAENLFFNSSNIYQSYTRAKQLSFAVQKLSGRKLPAFVEGNPYLSLLCKSNADEIVVGLFNIFEDSALNLRVELDSEYGEIEAIGCKAKLCGKNVIIEEIPPFSFAGISLKNKGAII